MLDDDYTPLTIMLISLACATTLGLGIALHDFSFGIW
jgi:hypothetical protein